MTAISIKSGSVVASNFYNGSDYFINNAVFPDVSLVAGERQIIVFMHRGSGGKTISIPTWGTVEVDSDPTRIVSSFGPEPDSDPGNKLFRMTAFEFTALTTGTHDIEATISDYDIVLGITFTLIGDFDTTPFVIATPLAAFDPWVAPAFTLSGITSGDKALGIIGVSAYKSGYDILSTVEMTSSQMTLVDEVSESPRSNYIYNLQLNFGDAANGSFSWEETDSYEPGFGAFIIVAKALPVSGPTIVSINADDTVTPLESSEMVVSDFVAASLTIDGIDVEDFVNIDDINYTFVVPFFAENAEYSPFNTAVDAIAVSADEIDSATLSVTLNLPSGWTELVVASLSTDPDSLAEKSVGITWGVGDTMYALTSEITLYDDTTFGGAAAGAVYVWQRVAATNVMHRLTVINGEVVAGDGFVVPVIADAMTAISMTAITVTAR